MDPQIDLDRLKADHTALSTILASHKEQTPAPSSPGVSIAMRIYLQILEDALRVLQSLIGYYET